MAGQSPGAGRSRGGGAARAARPRHSAAGAAARLRVETPGGQRSRHRPHRAVRRGRADEQRRRARTVPLRAAHARRARRSPGRPAGHLRRPVPRVLPGQGPRRRRRHRATSDRPPLPRRRCPPPPRRRLHRGARRAGRRPRPRLLPDLRRPPPQLGRAGAPDRSVPPDPFHLRSRPPRSRRRGRRLPRSQRPPRPDPPAHRPAARRRRALPGRGRHRARRHPDPRRRAQPRPAVPRPRVAHGLARQEPTARGRAGGPRRMALRAQACAPARRPNHRRHPRVRPRRPRGARHPLHPRRPRSPPADRRPPSSSPIAAASWR